MNQRKTLFIINPNANMGNAWRQAADLRPIMEEYGGADWTGSVYPTHAIELAKKAVEDGYELIIAGGRRWHRSRSGQCHYGIPQREKARFGSIAAWLRE